MIVALTKALFLAQPCPPPTVYVVPEIPWAWIALSGILFFLWVVSALSLRALRSRQPEFAPRPVPTPSPAPLIEVAPTPAPPPVTPPPDYSAKLNQLAGALRNLGYKDKDIKQKIALLDPSLPLEDLIREALKKAS